MTATPVRPSPRAVALHVLQRFRNSRLDARELLERSLHQARSNQTTEIGANDDEQKHKRNAFARELTLGVLRQRSLLDYQIQPFLKTSLERTDPALLFEPREAKSLFLRNDRYVGGVGEQIPHHKY